MWWYPTASRYMCMTTGRKSRLTPAAIQKISGLNAEAKQHREAKEAAEAKLKAFDGIDKL